MRILNLAKERNKETNVSPPNNPKICPVFKVGNVTSGFGV
jgi:hypothetical protein